MRTNSLGVLAGAVLLLGGVAHGQDAVTTAPVKPKEKQLCRSETPTGSMFQKKVCHTKAEWDQIQAASQKTLEQNRNNSAQH